MSWKESNLISDLSARYFAVDSDVTILQPEDIKGISWISVNVFETGISEKEKTPIANRKNIEYYVYHRGQGDEEAWYSKSQPGNQSNTDVSVVSGTAAYSYSTIFNSGELRNRTLGYIIKAIPSIIHESEATQDHILRLNWANDAIQNPNKYLDAFMVVISNNTTVRSNGNGTLDGDLEWIVNSEIKTIAVAYNFSEV